jgi:hypothetical protein
VVHVVSVIVYVVLVEVLWCAVSGGVFYVPRALVDERRMDR